VRFRIETILLCDGLHLLHRECVFAEPRVHQAQLALRVQVVGSQRQDLLEHLFCHIETAQIDQRAGRRKQQLLAVQPRRRVLGERENIARHALRLRHRDALLPIGKQAAEILRARVFQILPIHRLKALEV
jgi:hypothetical protein